jgi:hypothetical protein
LGLLGSRVPGKYIFVASVVMVISVVVVTRWPRDYPVCSAQLFALTDVLPLDRLLPPKRLERRAERRRLRRLDAVSARLAELHAIRGLLQRTVEVVTAGWVQGAWFTVASAGGERTITACDLRLVLDRPVTGACLVGAVVQAAGGPATVRSQLVQRTLDPTWHALREDLSRPVH